MGADEIQQHKESWRSCSERPMSAQEPMSGDVNLPSCTSAFDALWFCYSPVNQV